MRCAVCGWHRRPFQERGWGCLLAQLLENGNQLGHRTLLYLSWIITTTILASNTTSSLTFTVGMFGGTVRYDTIRYDTNEQTPQQRVFCALAVLAPSNSPRRGRTLQCCPFAPPHSYFLVSSVLNHQSPPPQTPKHPVSPTLSRKGLNRLLFVLVRVRPSIV